MSSSAQHFSLRWNDYLRHVTRAFDTLRSQDCLVDVTLSCEGKQLRAHKMLLSACSTYFRDLFKENPCQHPIIILKNVKFEDLEALVEFMYQGEVNVVQDQLTSFLTTAELLAVQGLTDGTAKDVEHPSEEITLEPPRPSKPKIKPSIENRTPSPTSSRSSKKRRRTQNSEESTSKKSLSEDSDEVTFVPLVMPSLKVEVPDYVDTNIHLEQSAEHTSEIDEPADNSCDYDDSNTKTESMDMSNIVYEEQADDFTGTEMSHILDNPGTSDNQQDSTLQDVQHILLDNENYIILQPLQNLSQETIFDKDQFMDYDLIRDTYPCFECGKIFKHPDSLRQHNQQHRGSTQCPICNLCLSRTYELKVHMKKKHHIYEMTS